MRPRRVQIDPVLLRTLYVDQRLTTTAIARRTGCGASTIARRLRRLGVRVRRRGPDRDSPRSGAGTPPPRWCSQVAWIVGLIATDGNLGRRGRVSITSKDIDLLESARRCLGLSNRFARVVGGWGGGGYRLQWGNRAFYDWLLAIGLTPRKSLTIGPLAVPDEYFPDFLRGCIDGDGTVLVYTDRQHASKNARYVYTRLYVSLVSASRAFVDWLRATIHRLLGCAGGVHVKWTPAGRRVWNLRYAKAASMRLLRWIYYAPDVPCLARKRAKADPFIVGAG